MLHAGNAVDGTAKKRYPQQGVATRFKRTIRDSLDIFQIMAAPGIDFEQSRIRIAVKSDMPDACPDFADALYGSHRSNDGQHAGPPEGFQPTPRRPPPARGQLWATGE